MLNTLGSSSSSPSSPRACRIAFTPPVPASASFSLYSSSLHLISMPTRFERFKAAARQHLPPRILQDTPRPGNHDSQQTVIPVFSHGTSLEKEVEKRREFDELLSDSNETTVWRLLEVTRRRLRNSEDEGNFERWAKTLEEALNTPDKQYYRPGTNCDKVLELIEDTWAEPASKRKPFVRPIPHSSID